MIVEEVFDKRNTPLHQRRPTGHANASSGTKRGNKKRSARRRMMALLDEEAASDEDDDEDDSEAQRRSTSCASNSSLLNDNPEALYTRVIAVSMG
jgi:hypothetical protein